MTSRIMIVTGEASGDLHGANLVRALRSKISDMEVCGMGGAELASVGVDILYDAAKVSVVGIIEVFSHIKDIISAQRVLRKRLITHRPDLLILIDLPDFNLFLAKKAKYLGIPVFYYISPQVWAWRSGRVKTLRDRVDKIGVILPFEEEFFHRRGVNAEYVGHPLLDTVVTSAGKEQFCTEHQISLDTRCIGLFPGSRKREISSLLPGFLEAGRILQSATSEKLVFLVPQASTITTFDLEEAGIAEARKHLDIRIIKEERYNMMAACAVVVAASGTVTLELAILEVPMIVAYKLSPLTYFLGRLLVNLKYFSLVNLIAGYRAVPELLQSEVTPKKIADELMAILLQPGKRQEMKKALRDVKARLGTNGASEKAAVVAVNLLNKKILR
ncbi:MAG: lipid-A-disaccharide synthase [Proteobacteria bacterium]|nr:lipid-A-disaccharide synthase [Pseudomonadota bacterium]